MKFELNKSGFEIIENVFSNEEVNEIIELLEPQEINKEFGIREFLTSRPQLSEKVFSKRLLAIVQKISPGCQKAIKSIYFDKPPNANWVVNWHQDLTINLKNRLEFENFKNWRENSQRIVVQPPIEILENIFTIRIHLDDCSKENGALRVIENSHKKGVIEIKEWMLNKNGIERICEVKRGGILIMKPLLLHSSKRTENQNNRRVIHIEFTDKELPSGLFWKEILELKSSNSYVV
ncbi:MAG TPA: phytanoyl-CoA dioxygenase family protein [Saprospiraceae bacterium]|nr:phytanoyl-CoA dioxygenase family protein [Saprospiraceae bacterium]HPN68663.1 phytanoyl-CoA dioxygenase family protein [Saprospiraceae bacterium]